MTNSIPVTSESFPEAFAAMDEAAKEFWTYPPVEWQDAFLRDWAYQNDPQLLNLLGD